MFLKMYLSWVVRSSTYETYRDRLTFLHIKVLLIWRHWYYSLYFVHIHVHIRNTTWKKRKNEIVQYLMTVICIYYTCAYMYYNLKVKKNHKKRFVYKNQVIKCIFILINFANFTNNIRNNKISSIRTHNTYRYVYVYL